MRKLIKMGSKASNLVPVVSKRYCSSSEVVLLVRRRPNVVNGGGFVVTNCKQDVIFRVDGCGILGTKGQLLLRDTDGEDLLLISKRGRILQALPMIHNKWEGYSYDYEGSKRPVFTLKDPKDSCFAKNGGIRISAESNSYFEIKGSFPDRACSIVDSLGKTVAQVGLKKETEEMVGDRRELYHVVIKPGIDQAFVFGVIAILDYIHGESTSC